MSTQIPPIIRRRRRIWPWVVALAAVPVLVFAAAAASALTLDRDASALRRNVMKATGANWDTRVQVSVGRVPFVTVRACLSAFGGHKVEEARAALAAVRSVSVGVYELRGGRADWSAGRLLESTDRDMERRGWTRVVGVADGDEFVLVYARDGDGEPDEFCVAVADGSDLVIVSAEFKPDALRDLISRHAGRHGVLKRAVKFASF